MDYWTKHFDSVANFYTGFKWVHGKNDEGIETRREVNTHLNLQDLSLISFLGVVVVGAAIVALAFVF